MHKKSSVKLFTSALFLAVTLLLINACNNNNDPAPVNTATKVIGDSGGELSGSDGTITLKVPEGAIPANTKVSIEATDEVAPKGIGKVYTLTPEGTQFTKPVSLSFQYTDADTKSIPAARMAIAYKKEDNTWQVMPTLKLDESTKTITTETTHFSQWSLIDAIPSITSFDPASGIEDFYTTINITGVNFSTVASENIVTLNGIPLVVNSASTTQLIVTLAPGATTGPFKIAVNGGVTLSNDDFIIVSTAPTITVFTPTSAVEGIITTVSITGTNFSSTISENIVSINGIPVTVAAATSTQLMVVIPSNATTGPLQIIVNGKTVVSSESFTILSTWPMITSFTPTSGLKGLSTTVIITGENFSSIASENIVTLNGLPVMVVSSTSTTLSVITPADATTGQFKITIKDKLAISGSSFTIN